MVADASYTRPQEIRGIVPDAETLTISDHTVWVRLVDDASLDDAQAIAAQFDDHDGVTGTRLGG